MATIALVVGLIVGIGAGWVAKPAEVTTAPGATATVTTTRTVTATPGAPAGLSGEVKIGWVDGLTGGNAFWGEAARTAADVALSEVNQYLSETNAGWTMSIVYEDSETKPDIALEKLKSLHARGITIVGGWGTSADLRASISYSNSNKILLLAYGSNAADLAIPDDYTYRLMPTTKIEGKCFARIAHDLGTKYLVPMWRGDTFGDSMMSYVRDYCSKLGITVDEGVRYDPNATEFSSEAAAFASRVNTAISTYGADKVSVYIHCFEEGKAIFSTLKAYNPTSWGVHWVGVGGLVLTDWALETDTAETISEKGVYGCLIPTPNPKLYKVQAQIKAKLGREADIYGLNGYDAVWILALAMNSAKMYDADAVKAQLPWVVSNYTGVTGWSPFDEAGDREGSNYGLFQVVKSDGTYKWAQIGIWDFGLDQITWWPEPQIVS
ncbi:MAG: ABC transporter substrate-binding protein [Candidatus Hadarchaeum sp.]|uniref:ABC transporter substrate-binding protein n=2 Tax=Candidatus Hadarchaeum sp. TaxID=2883567 RepID=UPI00317CD29A